MRQPLATRELRDTPTRARRPKPASKATAKVASAKRAARKSRPGSSAKRPPPGAGRRNRSASESARTARRTPPARKPGRGRSVHVRIEARRARLNPSAAEERRDVEDVLARVLLVEEVHAVARVLRWRRLGNALRLRPLGGPDARRRDRERDLAPRGEGRGASKPVAMTLIFTWSRTSASFTRPKMMFASSSAACWMTAQASPTSAIVRSSPPVTLIRIARAPWIDCSSRSGFEMARWAASTARCSPARRPGPHQGHPHVLHDRLHVGEVEVHLAGDDDQVADPLHGLPEDVVGQPERLPRRDVAVDEGVEPLVRDRDERVDVLAQLGDPVLGVAELPPPLEGEGLRDDRHDERARLGGDPRDDGRRPGPRAASHAGGHEDHVRAREASRRSARRPRGRRSGRSRGSSPRPSPATS